MARIEDNLGNFLGICKSSNSLKVPTAPYFSVFMKPIAPYSRTGGFSWFGDTITVDEMASLGLIWGSTTPAVYDTLISGWKWDFYPRRRQLIITDSSGRITTRTVNAWSELCVNIEVLMSPQFEYHISASDVQPYIIVTQYYKLIDCLIEFIAYSLSIDNDDDDNDTEYHWVGKWMYHVYPQFKDIIKTIPIADCEKLDVFTLYSIITVSLVTNGKYPLLVTKGYDNVIGNLLEQGKNCMIYNTFLMTFVSMFSNSFMRGSGRHCYEPWMLWQMWKWINDKILRNFDRLIFDISPNWGDT